MTALRFRKRPVEVEAIQWTGDNYPAVNHFAASHFAVLDEQDRANCDDPEATAQVFDVLHSTWILVYTGDWIIRGIQGEHYPCRADVFETTYEPVKDRGRGMGPEDHYSYGELLLRNCETLLATNPIEASAQAGIASGHFQAANAGVAIRAIEGMTQAAMHSVPQPTADEPEEAASDG